MTAPFDAEAKAREIAGPCERTSISKVRDCDSQRRECHPCALTHYIASALRDAYAEGRREGIEEAAKFAHSLDGETIRLHAGEIRPAEMRTVKAVLGWTAIAIRALAAPAKEGTP